ncbi:MAG: AmpG family muropeptide MFS transporter, partial [Burkholderiaceae bacterium]|nr:AmpG family muropeptide MFS transporter [Burkholderiaceae bacterium]
MDSASSVNKQSAGGFGVLLHPRVITMLFLGFSAGIPILLIFSSLSLWLGEAGVERKAVTFFSWAALGYSFKFIWAPLVDQLPIPWLTARLGRRRSWMLLSQFAVVVAILVMASVDPASAVDALTVMALGAVLLGFSSATQDIVIDAYRIESAPVDLQAMM